MTALREEISESDKELALVLIKTMIANDPSERPPVTAIHEHPIFWEPSRILAFFQVFLFFRMIDIIIIIQNK